MSSRLLIISFAYPPSATPRAIQVARLLTHLDFKMVLVCADFRDPNDRSDENLRQFETANLTVIRVPFKQTKRDLLVASAAERLKLPILNKTPDAFKKWKPAALAAIDSLPHSHAWDTIVTFGAPMSDHLIGLDLKKGTRHRWIAHFSDPWVDNPFTSADPITYSLNRTLERRVLANADRVLFTSDETVDLVLRKYPQAWKEKAAVLSHAFESRLFQNGVSIDDELDHTEIVIRYLGDFYGPRTPKPLLQALADINRLNPTFLENIRVELIGNSGNAATHEVESLPPRLCQIKAPVGYEESLRLMREANGLLVIDAPADTSVFLPSKLVEYIGAERPIFGITPPGTAAKLIRELGGWVTHPNDDRAIHVKLIEFISFLRQQLAAGATHWGNPEVRARFEISRVVDSFSTILNDLT